MSSCSRAVRGCVMFRRMIGQPSLQAHYRGIKSLFCEYDVLPYFHCIREAKCNNQAVFQRMEGPLCDSRASQGDPCGRPYHIRASRLPQRHGKQATWCISPASIPSSRWGWAYFFLLADSPSVHDDVLITAFGETLRFFWSLRLQTLFPDRKFVVEVDEGIERGLAITFYQVDV